jgi:PilZ domain.
MLPIPENYLQSVCEIRTPEGRVICIGILEEMSDETIQIRKNAEILPILHCDTFVDIHVLHKTLESKSLVGKVYLSTPDMMRIIEVQNLSDFERRNFFRLKVSMDTQAYILPQGESEAAEAIQLFPVRVTDLSLSGCFLEAQKKLELGDRLVAAFPLTDSRLSFTCQVQRIPPSEGRYNGYGCMFVEMAKRQSDLLCTYIFEKQREQIKKSRSHLDF